MRRLVLALAVALLVPGVAEGARVVGPRERAACPGALTLRWTGGHGPQRVSVRRDRGRWRVVARTRARRVVLRVEAGHTYRVRLGRRVLAIVHGRACAPDAGPEAWRLAWAVPLDAYVNDSQWKAHPSDNSMSAADATYRFVVRPGVAGSAVRLRLANVQAYGAAATGAAPVTFGAVRVGVRLAGSEIVPGSTRAVTFGGAGSVTLEPGASVLSDPVALTVGAGQDLAVSLYLPSAVPNPPLHPQTFVTQYVTPDDAGDRTADESGAAFSVRQEPVYWLDAVHVLTRAPRSVVAIGDSITDGDQCGDRNALGGCDYSDDFGMDRFLTYPDALARRAAATPGLGVTPVVNLGVNGAISQQVADRVLAHDVLDAPGVTHAIVELGTNDVTAGLPASVIIANLTAIADRLRAHGIRAIGATLVPRGGYPPNTPQGTQTRAEVNDWIRTTDRFDGVLDIGRALGDGPGDNHFRSAYHSGDALHPNSAGYELVAQSLDLALLAR